MKNKYILIITLIIVGLLQGCSSPLILYVRNTNINIELGETYDLTINNLLDVNKYNKEDIKEIKNHLKITNDINFNEVGTYSIKISYKNQTKKIKFVIKDTTKPVIEQREPMIFNKGINLDEINLSTYFNINEFSSYTLSIDKTGVDINNSGEYPITIICQDTNHNEAIYHTTITIKEDNQLTSKNKSNEPVKKHKENNSNKSSANQQSPDINVPEVSEPEVTKPSGRYETYYYCLDHFNETYRKYTTLDQLIDAGHYIGGCGCNNYGYGQEWVES